MASCICLHTNIEEFQVKVAIPHRRRETSYWTDVEHQLEHIARNVDHTTAAQLSHRMSLVEFWAPKPGDKVLEVGCGQGDCTVVLAHAVGLGGQVVAVDTAPPIYGAPVPLAETHKHILSSGVGKQIEFHTCANLLDPKWEFPSEYFDLAVFAHCSWYMASLEELEHLFSRVRPWARRLGYAEWHPVPQSTSQVPHLAAILLQAHIRSYWPEHGMGNLTSLVTPNQARSLAKATGWTILNEEATDSSLGLEDGESWEIENAAYQVGELVGSKDKAVSQHVRELVTAQRDLLDILAGQGERESLPTYVFVAG